MSKKNAAPRVPDKSLKFVQTIGDLRDPYAFPKTWEKTFVSAMVESVDWHARGSSFYKKVLQNENFDTSRLKTLDDCAEIPVIPANFFKTHELLSVKKTSSLMHFTSSGTTGQKSQIFFDDWSFRAGQRMVDSVFEYFGFLSKKKTNYLLYSYETTADSKLGTAYTDNYLCKYAPVNEAFCALRLTGSGEHEFDIFGCIEKLQKYNEDGLPVRIFGFPAFLYFTLKRMKDLKKKKLKLPKESLVFLGGGWKGQADVAIRKEELYDFIVEYLGIPEHRIRDSFGAVEHPIPYGECKNHHFHVPVWSRVIIRDIKTLKPCAYGNPGFLHFLTPFITSVPVHSIMMGDLAILRDGAECGCGIESPYFEILGRAGTTKNKSCAITASELLRGK